MRERSAGRVACLLVLAALAAPGARADIVHLVDGRKIEGEVKLEGDTYVITGRSGIKTRVPKYMVRVIEKADPPGERVAKARKALEAKGEKATADEWSGLGDLAAGFRLREEAQKAYEKAVSLDPDHEAARKGLGQVSYGGKWIPEEEAMALQGKVKVGGRWVDREDAKDARPRPSAAAAQRKVDEAEAMVKAMGPDYVRCDNCSGTGISVWIPCHQCERSDKKGYCFFGDKYAICDRCKGTARFPGIKCAQCQGLGKYDPNKKRTPKGRYIPNGFVICPTCNGTGVEMYAKCLQCARCKYPGFCYFGEKYTICPKCFGAAKVPALPCARCQRSGLIRERR